MIGTMRKHSTWLWIIIIAATIVSFVGYFGPGGCRNAGMRQAGNLGVIDGEPIRATEYREAQNETALRHFLSNGEWPDTPGRKSTFDWPRETYFRLFLIKKIQDAHLTIADEMVANAARGILHSLNRGEPMPMPVFEAQVLKPHGLTVEDFERTLRHDLGIQQLYQLYGGSGDMVTPQEARLMYVRENEEISAQAVFFSASNYVDQVEPTPEKIAQFYTNQLANYRIPERVQVSYVEFPLTNYWQAAAEEMTKTTNFDQQYDLYAAENGTNYFGGSTNSVEAKAKFRAAFHRQIAGTMVVKAANDFATELFDMKPENDVANLKKLAEQKGFVVRESEPFDLQSGPKALPLHAAQIAFRLTADQPFAQPVPGENGVYVMALAKRLPSELPALDEIRPRVVADFTQLQSTMFARQATVLFYNTVTNELAQGKTFPAIVMETHHRQELLPPFSLSTRELPQIQDRLNLNALKQAVFSILPGHANYTGTEDGGVVVFVNSRLPVDEALMNQRLPQFIAQIRLRRQQEAFNAWFSRTAQQDPGMRSIVEQLTKSEQRGNAGGLQ